MLRRWVGKVIVREARGYGIESRRAQKIFSVRNIWSRFYHLGVKPLGFCPGSSLVPVPGAELESAAAPTTINVAPPLPGSKTRKRQFGIETKSLICSSEPSRSLTRDLKRDE